MKTVQKFTYTEGGAPREVLIDQADSERLVIRTRRKQSIQQLENRKFIQYILGAAFKEFELSLVPSSGIMDIVNQLRATRVPLLFYYRYSKDQTLYCQVRVDPNTSISYVAGYLDPEEPIKIKFIQVNG